jgi:N-terminal half of MaoC dehydratase
VPLELPEGLIGREYDRAEHGPVTEEELIAFARALGSTEPCYTQPGPGLIAHPTFCVQFRGTKFYPENLPREIDFRTGLDAGKDVELGVPLRPGDTVHVSCTVHEVYEKTGRSGSMFFLVTRFRLANQRGEMLAVIDNRFMHR